MFRRGRNLFTKKLSTIVLASALAVTGGSLPALASDTTPPQIQSAELTNSTTLLITFTEQMATRNATGGGGTVASGFSVSFGGETAVAVDHGAITNTTLQLTMPFAVQSDVAIGLSYTPGTVQDTAGNQLSLSGSFSVNTTNGAAAAAPSITSAALGGAGGLAGRVITLTFSEPMRGINAPSGFTVKVNGVSISSDRVTVGTLASRGTTLTLTTDLALQQNSNVTVDYAGSSILDLAGIALPASPGLDVNESSAPVNAVPTIVSAVLNGAGTQITVNFSEYMEERTNPVGFSVSVDTVPLPDSQVTAGQISAGSNRFVITLGKAVQQDSSVVLEFTGASDRIEDLAEQDLATGNLSVNVGSGPLGTTPTVTDAILASDGRTVTLSFSEYMKAATPAAGFTATVGGVSKSISSIGNIDAAGTSLTITLAAPAVQSTATLVLSYTAGSIQDLASSPLANFTRTVTTSASQAPGDTTAPEIQSSVIDTNGTTLTITFTESMAGATSPSGFSIVTTGNPAGINPAVTSTGNLSAGGTTLVLTLTPAVEENANVRLVYAPGSVEDLAGNNLAAVNTANPASAAQGSVDNNSIIDRTAPTVASAALNNAGTQLIVTFSEGMEYRAAVSPAASAANGLSVAVGGESVNITSLEMIGGTNSLRLVFGGGVTVPSTADVVLSYVAGNSLEDDSLNDSGNDLSFVSPTVNTSVSTAANTAPTIRGATLAADGVTLTVDFSEAMENRSLVASAASVNGLSVTVAGVSRNLSAAAITSNATSIVLTLASAAETGQTVILSYASGPGLEDRFGADLSTTGFPFTVTNNSDVDTVAPTVSSASLAANGTTLTITFSEGMEARLSGALSGFTVRVGGVSFPFSYGTITAGERTLDLNMNSAIQSGAPVTLDFAGGSNLVEDDDNDGGNDLASFTGTVVTNSSSVAGDTTVPTIQSAVLAANGTTLTITFTDTMAAKTAPAGFTVTVGGVTRTQTAGNISALVNTLVLTMGTAVEQGATVLLNFAYSANAVEDLAGNDLAAITGVAVTNNSTVASTAPTATAALGTNGTTLTLTFSEDMKSSATPTGFVVKVGGVSVPFAAGSITGGGTTLVLTLTTAVQAGNTVTLDYTSVANQIEDLANVDLASFTALAVTNNSSQAAVAPTITSRTVNAAGTVLSLVFSENMEARTPATGFTVKVGGTVVSATIGNISAGGTTLDLNLANVIQQGATVTVSFAGGTDVVEDLAQVDLAAVTDAAVTNNSTVTTVVVTFSSNYTGGAASTTQTVNAGVATALTTNSFTRTGYTFAGWNTVANGSGTSYANGASLTTNAAITLFAQWTAVSQTVTYRAGGATGTVPVQANVGTDGTFTVATAANLSRPGYTFDGWSDGTSKYQPGATYTVGTSAVTLTAQWTVPSAVGTPVALPTNVTGSAGNASATVTWQITVGAGELTPTSYVVEFSTDGGRSWSGANATGTGLSRTVTGLSNGVSYVFRVTAVATNSTATSAQSAAVTPVDPNPVVVPDPVTPTKRVTVGTFNGFIAIYTVGYEGSRMSARVAGRWLNVNPITNVSGKTYSLTRRNTGAGFNIRVDVYIDGQLVTSQTVRTR